MLQTFKFTIYSMHYKHRNACSSYTNLGGTKKFSARFACEFNILYPHYGIRGIASADGVQRLMRTPREGRIIKQ